MGVEFNNQHAQDFTKYANKFPKWFFLIYNSNIMDRELRFYQRTWFFPVSLIIFFLGIYIWYIVRMGGFQVNLVSIVLDLLLFLLGMLLWLAFFAQFVLPVDKLGNRLRIYNRLLLHILGGHGQAILIRDGQRIADQEEISKSGPGVIWLDSASAAQLRTATKFTRTIGPGVHFTNHGETIAGIVDLHMQVDKIEPRDKDESFGPQPANMSDEEYKARQQRVSETRALTRDGIEVVANISTTLKIDADPVVGDRPGSRFGYFEPGDGQEDQHPVFKAIASEGVNPDEKTSSNEQKIVSWNQYPTHLAADLWREYLSKFKLIELFTPILAIPPKSASLHQPAVLEASNLKKLEQTGTQRSFLKGTSDQILQQTNRFLKSWVERLEKYPTDINESASKAEHPEGINRETQNDTALDVINAMIKERMTQPFVKQMDPNGKFTGSYVESQEFKWLKDRGLRILSASVSGLRFAKEVEEGLVNRWNATWESNAKAKRDAIERLRKMIEIRSREQELYSYLHGLSRDLLKEKSNNQKEKTSEQKEEKNEQKQTLKELLLHSRSALIRADRLERRLSTEIDELSEVLHWVENQEQ